MSWSICIGGVCIPAFAWVPFAVIVLQNLWQWFRIHVLGQTNSDAHLFENSRVVHVTSMEQWKELHEKSKATKRSLIVDFTASWCPPCRYIAPIFHDLSNKYPCSIFLKVDVDELKQISSSCGVRAMPTFQFYKNGAKVDEQCGADKNALENYIKKHYVEVDLPEEEQPKEIAANVAGGNAKEDSELRQRKVQITTVTTLGEWEDLQKRTQEAGKTLVVDFWATWCGPCKKIAPFYESLSGKYPSVVFAKVDVDVAEEVAAAEKVDAMPTFKVFKNGKCVDTLEGAIQTALEAMVTTHM